MVSNIAITIQNSKSESISILQYKIVCQDNANLSEGMKILTDLNNCVSQVKVSGLSSKVELLLRALIVKEYVNLNTLIVGNSKFHEYTSENNIATPVQYIKNLIFRSCIIEPKALKSFSNEFDLLDYVKFDNCSFLGDPNIKPISMPKTMTTEIHMTNFHKMISRHKYQDNIENLIIISAHFTAQDYTKYYLTVENYLVQAITKAPFDLLCDKLDPNEVVVVNIKVKLAQELVFKLTDYSKKVKITFPKWQ